MLSLGDWGRALRVAKEKSTHPKKAGIHAKRYTAVLNMQYIRSIIHMYTYYDLHIYIGTFDAEGEKERDQERERE